MNNENNRVKIYGRDCRTGKNMVHVTYYLTADEAYEDYKKSVRFFKECLPIGETITVVRERWGNIMAMETITH